MTIFLVVLAVVLLGSAAFTLWLGREIEKMSSFYMPKSTPVVLYVPGKDDDEIVERMIRMSEAPVRSGEQTELFE